MEADQTLDAKGLQCPMPLVKAQKAIKKMKSGEILKIVTNDSGSYSDIPAWAKTTGNKLIERKEEEGMYIFWIQKS
ncbi:sulfurtransferase TusA family protein [Thermoactinomyces mirandus]|uniref:Sulfurtransferase TusA family protein n=1 Tax=Thermoactinomyces mirandus TaxID=2756294 RepID=A0A7W1XV49_9BACL|nr:sulfurtransferase TusA family protein [Thermoactinomyces mirandus]MBA4603632.1 sulfurtransferase TusA family protein [Thermoactinomyces mirandus]